MPSVGNSKGADGSDALDACSRRVAAMLKQMEALKSALTTQLDDYDEAELSVRLEYVEQVNATFQKAQSALEESSSGELEIDGRMSFVSLYLDVKSKLTRQLNNTRRMESNGVRSSTCRQFSLDPAPFCGEHSRRTRLPEIQLPKFDGAYADWPNFFALFSTVVNDNVELSNLEKLHYLRSNLVGAALDTISSLELNEANYAEALKLLKNRFDNKLLHFQTHINEIFALKAVDGGSAAGLRHLSDKLNAHLCALQTIASKEQISEGFLIYIAVSKMDKTTQMKWEENLSTNELPSWSNMTSFLERRCRMLENMEFSRSGATSKQIFEKNPAPRNRYVHIASSKAAQQCSLCDSTDHFISKCPSFANFSPFIRLTEAKRLRLCLNCLKPGHMLKECVSGSCRRCNSKHHTLLHLENSPAAQTSKFSVDQEGQSTSQQVLVSSHVASKPASFSVLLATAMVMVKNRSGTFVPCRAILDSASQLNLVTNRLVNRLHLNCNSTSATISGIGEAGFTITRCVDVVVKSRVGDFSTSFTAMVVPSITDYQPSVNISSLQWDIPKNIQLADPSFDKGDRVDMLIGAELFFELMSVGQIKIAANLPILQKTLFGWVVAGGNFRSRHSSSLAVSHVERKDEEVKLSSIMKSFWEVENNMDVIVPQSEDDIFCENHFVQNTIRLASGAYSVRLPQIIGKDESALGSSYDRAFQRFKGLERKLRHSPEIKDSYISFMREYQSLGHMSLISAQLPTTKYYLPHHCVQKLDSTSTKLRVVFDGSAKTTSGLSLNDILHAGPTIQMKLFNILLRYRFFKVALSGDICKMYRCVRVSHPDDYLQCILWRDNEDEEIRQYKLNTVTYGTKPAAFLAIRSMHQLAIDDEGLHPLGSKIVRRDFYVDDLISGGDSIEEVVAIRNSVSALLQGGNFVIRKWCSNVAEVTDGLPLEDVEQFLKFHDGTDVTKTLGLVWDPKSDNFIFSFNPIDDWKVVTKRSILSSIARLYDPLGLIGPVITKAKIFMQHLWKLQLQWDESLPQSLHSSWLEYISKFDLVFRFTFPRYVSLLNSNVQIHAFCDASLTAYGACVYVRSEKDNVIKSSLLCSKSRVAPLKALTVPKLELSAACLLAELVDVVMKSLDLHCDVHCWSDSTVVLSWLQEQPSNFNVFVSNRVARIQAITAQMFWHHVPTRLNPADILSRGATPEELLQSSLWNSGPSFLSRQISEWPDSVEFIADLPERRKNVLVTKLLLDLSVQCKYLNSFTKLQRVFAYVAKFLHFKSRKQSGELTTHDVDVGSKLLIRNMQMVHFSAEYKALKTKQPISSSSKIFSLRPMMDEFGLIRVSGRLQNSDLEYSARHPIILPKGHSFTSAMVMYYHQKLLHAGPQCLLATIRQRYWPVGGRKQISSIVSKCLRCFKAKPKLLQHVMGSLPADRVRPNRAFYTTGVDFCGPFYYKSEVKSRPPVKCYIAIFVCFSTKATHLEVVPDLSTPAFLCSLRRFISTRGKPKTIWSDNATNFVGAKNELEELRKMFSCQLHLKELHHLCLEDGIEWKFIPPRSPHFGGLWEAAVKSAKFHFYRAVGLNALTFDELRTLVCQISAILNSRPLCPLSEDPDDLDVLTPGHFLVGGPLVSIVEPDMSWVNFGHLNSWQKVSETQQSFWKKWSNSYLSLLQERSKWRDESKNIPCGAMVLLKDENLPPLKWQMGRVVDVICGDDGVVRVVNVKTANGIFKRAVSKLAALPIDDSFEGLNASTGGEC